MKYLRKIIGVFILSLSLTSHAGVYATTAHSRANCFNNESITWYLWHNYNWRVVSFHNYDLKHPNKGYHYIDTGMGYTWRQAAVHWNESAPGGTYFVSGFHYFLDRGREILDTNTQASDCSIYDGWWDQN
ncbi:hypothetical protein ACNVED_05365 [Legionella sp. D16C41]|uniref:hypothetical protein n=1 Tax=Legionella sp. D16C41 TaxID=3402688 RepID=UPI003AF600F1